MLEVFADEKLPCLCGNGYIKYGMCENENLFVFGQMELHCPFCSKLYKIEADESKTPYEERTFYLVPLSKSIHGKERESALTTSIQLPTPNDEDPKENEVLAYKELCKKLSAMR